VTSSELTKYSVTRRIARPLCDNWTSCFFPAYIICKSYRQWLLWWFDCQTLHDVQLFLLRREPVSCRSIAGDDCPHYQDNGGWDTCNVLYDVYY